MNKKNLILLLFFLLLCFGFWYIWKNHPREVVKIEIKENIEKIDSLNKLIKEDSLVIDSLKNVKAEIIERVIVKKEEIKSLSPDSTVKLFNQNILAYGEVGDSLETPKLMEDSTISSSVSHIKGANIITAKYESKVEENEVLQGIIKTEDGIIEKKDSVIHENSIILNNTIQAYDTELTNLNKQLKKEKVKKKMTLVGGGILLGILGLVITLK